MTTPPTGATHAPPKSEPAKAPAKPSGPVQPTSEAAMVPAKPGEPGSASSQWDKEHEPYKVPPATDDPEKAPK